MRKAKWYRSEKRLLRPFLHRIWYGMKRMRGRRHMCRAAERRIMMGGPDRWEGWQRMFEPVRVRRKVWRARRAVPYWTNGYDAIRSRSTEGSRHVDDSDTSG